jgi:hypothetical protein
VLDSKATGRKAIKAISDARSRFLKCRASMDPDVYNDLYRRFIERS